MRLWYCVFRPAFFRLRSCSELSRAHGVLMTCCARLPSTPRAFQGAYRPAGLLIVATAFPSLVWPVIIPASLVGTPIGVAIAAPSTTAAAMVVVVPLSP